VIFFVIYVLSLSDGVTTHPVTPSVSAPDTPDIKMMLPRNVGRALCNECMAVSDGGGGTLFL